MLDANRAGFLSSPPPTNCSAHFGRRCATALTPVRGVRASLGGGVLASLFFRAKAPGLATVELQRPTVTGPEATPRAVTVRRGQVRVR